MQRGPCALEFTEVIAEDAAGGDGAEALFGRHEPFHVGQSARPEWIKAQIPTEESSYGGYPNLVVDRALVRKCNLPAADLRGNKVRGMPGHFKRKLVAHDVPNSGGEGV